MTAIDRVGIKSSPAGHTPRLVTAVLGFHWNARNRPKASWCRPPYGHLVATDSIHATAAACDYLEGRLAPEDTVTVAALGDPGTRDAGDATNVATARLAGRATVETTRLTADDDDRLPGAVLVAADSYDVGEIVLDDRSAGEDERPSDAVVRIIDTATVPVVVVPGQA